MKTVEMRNGRKIVDVSLWEDEKHVYFRFPFAALLKDHIKAMKGARWEPDSKYWYVDNCPRNWFQIDFLSGKNPYSWYERKTIPVNPKRDLFAHQKDMVAHCLTYQQCILAAEMGTGKTLAFIETMEQSLVTDWWYVAPKSALKAVDLEFKKWKAKFVPQMFTYEKFLIKLKNWKPGDPAPMGVCFDEASKLKNPKAQRTEAALFLAESMRKEHKNPYIILMSGTPAPRSPADWWTLCEITCPGFIVEGTYQKFQDRLGVFETVDGPNGTFRKLKAWKKSETVCSVCGAERDDYIHDVMAATLGEDGAHLFKESINEVAKLYRRMSGLTIVKFKRDCLDLPDKHYIVTRLEPSQSMLAAQKLILAQESRAANALIKLRELSDGFQYKDVENGTTKCTGCGGTGIDSAANAECSGCKSTGTVTAYTRVAARIPTPKEAYLRDVLEDHSDVGRIVVYGGFTGSIDRIESVCVDLGWEVIRVDGRGWKSNFDSPLEVFQSDDSRKIAFIGHPGSAGMGLTLTKSPTILFYSNDFNAESRIQAEDRIHRPGMDINKGATIIDIIHLDCDEYILKSLNAKKDLQALTMGDLRSALNSQEVLQKV